MSSSHALGSEQPLHHSTFADLQLKISSQTIVARLLWYWDSPNIDNPSESMGITLLFLDEKGSMINRFIPANQAGDYRSSLQEGDIFEVANFEVERCPHMYKVTEHTFVIRFIAQTTFVKFISKDVVGQIQSVKGYGLTNPQVISPLLISFLIEPGYSPLRHGGHDGQPNKNWRLRTTVGEEFPSSHDKTWINDQQVSSIGDLNMFLSNTTDQEMLKLTNQDEATLFLDQFSVTYRPPTFQTFVAITRTSNILQVNGRDGNHGSGPRVWPVKDCRGMKESEKKAILVTFPPENTRSSDDEDSRSGDDDSSSGDDDPSSSDDDSSSGGVLIWRFDKEASRGTGREGLYILCEKLPQCIAELGGKEFIFHIRVTPFNFTPTHQTFTVSAISHTINTENCKINENPCVDVKCEEASTSASAIKMSTAEVKQGGCKLPLPQTSVPGVRHSTFEPLRLGRSSPSIAYGLLRFWDSLNFKKDTEFLDSWVYSARRANYYIPSLKTGSIVKVDHFEVARCSSMYKITDHSFLICFISPTIIDEVITGAPEINLQS
ncbi:hypothetical protein F2Q68_00013882 [Brassica cretica]|uniref:Replication protein A 70 kDa DNA-binding subunit B/D first OB fold domain-containing protein n=1 Tax=Brassica cretica TaxID=69181 RepID=A0A8S9HFF9_BRACR|nr:hypothetical protein F2Q68_00013882 [Brassica cretica]